jgi:Flp pilus assembly protein TadG
MIKRLSQRRLVKETRGVAMVEFALILIILLTILLGVIQFGLIWYTKYAVTCASREGARYGVVYQAAADGTRIPPVNLSPTIQQVVTTYLSKLCPTLNSGMYTIYVGGTGYTTGTAGTDLIVRVTCQNPWNLLGWLIPSLDSLSFKAETTMKCE